VIPISVDRSPEAFDGRSNENVAKTLLVERRNDWRSAVLGPGDVDRSRRCGRPCSPFKATDEAPSFQLSELRTGEGTVNWRLKLFFTLSGRGQDPDLLRLDPRAAGRALQAFRAPHQAVHQPRPP
jgi:hypothetical protein